MRPIVSVKGLSKRYTLGEREPYETLRTALVKAAKRPFGRSDAQRANGDRTLWALRDVTFDIMPGEVLGVVGRNGAGKSTLLKVLSRITEPTHGRAELYGRVGSLLEVGTGFHPELTGRENIFLNGTILGMTKAEIVRKFDEIVAFAEIEKFLETPVKRYSSGMYVRLAFSVAAHLEPEILIVDEVLAVGDARFQRKCLGKMQDVAHQGRTVVFVSHNMAVLQTLCTRGLLMDAGRLVSDDTIDKVINQYHRQTEDLASAISLSDRKDRRGTGALRFTGVSLQDLEGTDTLPMSGQPLVISLPYACESLEERQAVVRIAVTNSYGQRLFMCLSRTSHDDVLDVAREGQFRCTIPKLPLLPGRYGVSLWCKVGERVADEIQDAFMLEVLPGDYFGTGRLNPEDGGNLLVENRWEAQ